MREKEARTTGLTSSKVNGGLGTAKRTEMQLYLELTQE